MNRFLHLVSMATLFAGSVMAESQVFTFDFLGEVEGIADNGQFAVVSDPDFGAAYIWDAEVPHIMKDISVMTGAEGLPADDEVMATTAMDVSDDGIVVGSIQFVTYSHPAYYKDGKWHLLPLDPNALNTNEAVCITPDGSVIAGYHFLKDPTADKGGHFYPCQWFLQADGSYTLKSYTDIVLPDHQGFFPLTQTPDGKVIGGTVYCGMGSRINALIKDEKLVIFEEITEKDEPWMYKGKYYAGVDENGKQIWVEDVNDPRVVLFKEVYISGYKDGIHGEEGFLNGFFTNCDSNGNLYGSYTIIENVQEDGDGDVSSAACIYNYLTDTWYTDERFSFFSAGIKNELLFTENMNMIAGDEIIPVSQHYGYTSDADIAGISKISADGSVLGAVVSELNPAIGEMMYYPCMIVSESTGVNTVAGNPSEGLVLAGNGRIEVLNADEVAVYDLNGNLLSTDKVTDVASGIYIVKAGKTSHKIIVR